MNSIKNVKSDSERVNKNNKLRLLDSRKSYKPLIYPWAYEAWETQQKISWLPEEVPMADDVQDWKHNISSEEKNLLTQIFRFFTQSDLDVHCCYTDKYLSLFKHPEIKMMLTAFANMETIHVASYSHLLDTVGMPESEYSAFLEYKEMCDKHDFLKQFDVNSLENIAKTLAVYGAFTEGLQLFASFVILLNFPRFNKMKGMGQIISFSIRDETLHTVSMIKLFNTFVDEYDLLNKNLIAEIREICKFVVINENKFIDLAFEMGDVKGLSSKEVKDYVKFIANRRLQQLRMQPLYEDIKKNPLPWFNEAINAVEHTNFFENRVTEYSRSSTEGKWEDVFD
ncbi:ribonucleotide-diphosphate reductase subunit beta [Anaplasmataceae bacterium AB001_6]|nr:ribonucleotide-diphosphate reductase subunit beta [Anaplasmataceae bacterium AB001_6]